MADQLQPGMTLPDFELPDETGEMHRLSELQGDNPMILMLGRGEHCPRERQHQKEMIKLHEWCAVGFTTLVTLLPNDRHETYKLKISTPAGWTYLCDENLEVQGTLGIHEYTDPGHRASVPHTVVLAPGLMIDKVYVGYWFFGRPSAYQLWEDLQDLFRRIKGDFDPTRADVRQAWEQAHSAVAA
ncbi:MAG TPA: redoxin domain-containing protein [Solirubrobacteraceae bacterium]|nr:redoxin domain-containing protein [Solirubrobacteraceae bacterium]